MREMAMKMMTSTTPEPRTGCDIDLSEYLAEETDPLKHNILSSIQIFLTNNPDIRNFEIIDIAETVYKRLFDSHLISGQHSTTAATVEVLFTLARRGEFEIFVQRKDENGNLFGPTYSSSSELKKLEVSEDNIAFCLAIKGLRTPKMSIRHAAAIALLSVYLFAVVYWFQIKG